MTTIVPAAGPTRVQERRSRRLREWVNGMFIVVAMTLFIAIITGVPFAGGHLWTMLIGAGLGYGYGEARGRRIQ